MANSMEDRYDMSVDIGDGKDWWYIHGPTTHDKVYGVNKQMCDIDKHLSEAGYFGMICEGQVEARKKLKDMEEKKTKKMTKAEAFEYFKKKKILAKEGDANIGVQEKLFQCGIEWANGGRVPFYHSDYLIVEERGRLYHCGLDDRYWFAHHYESIDADDILSIEIIDENKSEEEKALDKISCLGAQIVDILLRMKGHHHVTITETTVTLHDEGMSLFHSDPF